MSQDACVLDCMLKFSVPQPQNFLNVPTTLALDLLFLPKQIFSNKKIWCLETKLWSKVTFSQCVQGYAEMSVWFVHVTNCYCSGKKNLNKFFLTATKLPVVQSHPYWWGHSERLWLCLFDRNACEMNRLSLHIEKRGCVVV